MFNAQSSKKKTIFAAESPFPFYGGGRGASNLKTIRL